MGLSESLRKHDNDFSIHHCLEQNRKWVRSAPARHCKQDQHCLFFEEKLVDVWSEIFIRHMIMQYKINMMKKIVINGLNYII
jgi:hypothetical protein